MKIIKHKFKIHTSYKFKNRNICLHPKLCNRKKQKKKYLKKIQSIRKRPFQIIHKPTDVTYKLIDSNKKGIVQHRNNLLPYYPKEYAP